MGVRLRLQEAHEALHVFLGQAALLFHETAKFRVVALLSHGLSRLGHRGFRPHMFLDVQELMGFELVRHDHPPRSHC